MKLIPWKQWIAEQAQRNGVSPSAIFHRLERGTWICPERVKIGNRYWMNQDEDLIQCAKLPTRYSLAKRMAELDGVTIGAIYNRMKRAKAKTALNATGRILIGSAMFV